MRLILFGLLPVATWSFFHVAPVPLSKRRLRKLSAVKPTSASTEEAGKLMAQAEQMRMEAEKMDLSLTLHKIENLENRLNNADWLEKHPDEEAELVRQLESLNDRLSGESKPSSPAASIAPEEKAAAVKKEKVEETAAAAVPAAAIVQSSKPQAVEKPPLTGFTSNDLDLYVPLAEAIEKNMANATATERLAAFQAEPALQEHFQSKIEDILMKPLMNMKKMDDLKGEYMRTSSAREKENLKTQLERLEQSLMEESPFVYTDSFNQRVAAMPDEELEARVAAMSELPQVMQDMFKGRHGVSITEDLQIAILLDHYSAQIEVLDQIKYEETFDQNARQESIDGFNTLPTIIQAHFQRSIGLAEEADAGDVVDALRGGSASNSSPVIRLMDSGGGEMEARPEYSDLGFMERSRFAEELIAPFTYLEEIKPPMEDVDAFVEEVLGRDSFSLSSKPERVMGGYYLRGVNHLRGDDASDRLVEKLSQKLSSSSVDGKVQFFYINDPTALTDEELEMQAGEEPILALAAKDTDRLYKTLAPWKKAFISATGFFCAGVFALGASSLNGATEARLLDNVNLGNYDISWLTDMTAPTFFSLLAIAGAHEVAHRIVAWKDKVRSTARMFDINSSPLMCLL